MEKPHPLAIRNGSDKYGVPMWTIEINNLDELIKLVRENKIVLRYEYDEMPQIEIYDDWRE